MLVESSYVTQSISSEFAPRTCYHVVTMLSHGDDRGNGTTGGQLYDIRLGKTKADTRVSICSSVARTSQGQQIYANFILRADSI